MEESKLTILIVDDEEPIKDILSRKLELDSYNCEAAIVHSHTDMLPEIRR